MREGGRKRKRFGPVKFLSPENSKCASFASVEGTEGIKIHPRKFHSLFLALVLNASAAAIHILRYLTGISRAAGRSWLFAHCGLKAIDRRELFVQLTLSSPLPLALSPRVISRRIAAASLGRINRARSLRTTAWQNNPAAASVARRRAVGGCVSSFPKREREREAEGIRLNSRARGREGDN